MDAEPQQAIAVFITAPNSEEAAQLAEMLVDKRLAACVQIMRELQSIFRWQGKVEWQREVLLIAKTVSSKFAELESEVIKLHSYETPEIVAFPLTHGSRPYLEWLAAEVSGKDHAES
ncbi:MAG TPA: divalent-cation tolerance protein CutA [Pyrinomonadaceae bacterium]|jgi:periplasmic divalent cation tolerance protein|nr:divalent-cation tolerance protein CutA [Pyrinomonadaceae bacterium]